MKTRAQQSRDAALRRLGNVNRSLAVAAVLSTGVITDVVANTASGHTRTTATGAGASAGFKPALLESGPSNTSAAGRARARHAASLRSTGHKSQTSSSSGVGASSSSSSSQSLQTSPAPSANVPPPAPAPTVVAVSGGS